MSQTFRQLVVDGDAFGSLYGLLNSFFDAVGSCFKGSTPPPNHPVGGIWVDDSDTPLAGMDSRGLRSIQRHHGLHARLSVLFSRGCGGPRVGR